ncbi:hypothetical protein NQZ79_g808 [Umbelopsis isabellina]|nr:hypothetical protein NQZ79_g808 [Umbelopsis isabellina]
MSSSALLKALSNFDTCNYELTQLVRKTLLDPIEPSKKLTKKDIETYQRSLVPLAMNIVNQNLGSFGKLYERTSNTAIATEDSDMISCLVDTSFFALKTLQILNDTKAVKQLDVEKARSNLITKLINIKQVRKEKGLNSPSKLIIYFVLFQYERALQELLLFRAHLASIIGINLDAHSSDHGEKTVLTEALNTPSTPASPRPSKTTARQLTAELYSATNSSKHLRSPYLCLLNLPMQQNMNNVSMVRLILASQLNAIRCFVEMDNGTNISVKYTRVHADK